MKEFLASDDAILSLGKQIKICDLMGDTTAWPQISPEHGKELLREIAFWRKIVRGLDEDEE